MGISGGVDSSVSAYLLKKEGYEVHGVYIKPWAPEWLPCNWMGEKRDAMRVCAKLGIRFHFVDGEEVYKNEVAKYMIDEYKHGRTPNPDILCNRVIKFGLMWEYAKSNGADFIATGHYAYTDGKNLFRGFDEDKDQSYFLWMLKSEELAHIKFPLGKLKKYEVRKIAEEAYLHTASKKDSQGICFLGEVDIREFLSHYIEQKRGDVVLENGKVIGFHQGVWFYTIGERHGFTITEKNSERSIYYVIGKNTDENVLIVATEPRSVKESKNKKVTLRDSNWLDTADKVKNYTSQLRYHGEKISTQVIDNNHCVINYENAVPLGQSLVVFDNDKLIGGGIIDQIQPLDKTTKTS